MYKKKLCKGIIFACIILAVSVTIILSRCERKEIDEAVDANRNNVNDISMQNDIGVIPEEGMESLETTENSDDTGTSTVKTQVDDKEAPQTQNQTEDANVENKIQQIDSVWVIRNTVSELKGLIPELTYSEDIEDGQVIEVTISTTLAQTEVAGVLYDSILDLLEYDQYLESKNNPEQTQSVVLDYTYGLKYKGVSKDVSNHIFEFGFVMNEQSYQDMNFDSAAVVSQVTERILKNSELHVELLNGNDYKTTRMIEGVQCYETTAEAVESLTRYVENEIRSMMYGIETYTKIRLEFYAKGITSYTFILYLG